MKEYIEELTHLKEYVDKTFFEIVIIYEPHNYPPFVLQYMPGSEKWAFRNKHGFVEAADTREECIERAVYNRKEVQTSWGVQITKENYKQYV